MPRINQSVETMVMNDKGEMVSKRANTVMSWGDEPSYIKLYLQDIMYLSDMPKKYVAVTEALLKRIAYAGDEDGLCVSLLPRTKKAICDELGWKTVASLDNALQKLLAGKILYRVGDLPSHSPSPVRRHQHPYQSLRPQPQGNAAAIGMF